MMQIQGNQEGRKGDNKMPKKNKKKSPMPGLENVSKSMKKSMSSKKHKSRKGKC